MTQQRTASRKQLWRILSAALALLCVFVVASAVVWPEASGKKVAKSSGTVIDYSHAEDGYIMVKQSAGKKRYKLRIQKDGETYTYDLNNKGTFEVFPLQLGTGSYKVSVYKQSSGSKYSNVSGQTIKVPSFTSEQAPYLCPNQYVNYNPTSMAVRKADELCAGLSSDAEKVQAVRDYIMHNIRYDYIQALTVEKGYLPDLDEMMKRGSGICFDYAALTACMLRSQGIPVQLAIGYADKTYHAWDLVMIDGKWQRVDLTSESTAMKVSSYTIERVY